MWEDFEEIWTYTRADAIEVGLLIDVSKFATRAGFSWPVVVTAEVWQDSLQLPGQGGPLTLFEAERVCELLYLLMNEIKRGEQERAEIPFLFQRPDGSSFLQFALKAVFVLDDNGSPCITILNSIGG